MNGRPKLVKKLCTLIFLLATLSVVTSNSAFALVGEPAPARDCSGVYNNCMADCGGRPGCNYHCEDVLMICLSQ